MNKERENGYYWVLSAGGEWMIAEFYNPDYLTTDGYWSLFLDDDSYNDIDFREIDEKRIICPHE